MATPFIRFPGVTGNYVVTAHDATLDITGDIDIRASYAAPGGTTAGGYLLSRWFSSNIFRFFDVANQLTVQFYVGGVAQGLDTSIPWDATRRELKVTRTAVDGWIRAYVEGSEVASVQRTSGALDTGTEPFYVGSRSTSANPWSGDVRYAEVRNGLDGPVVARLDAVDAARAIAL